MTLYICDKHGTSGHVESCEHVRYEIESGNTGNVLKIKAYMHGMLVCRTCIEKHKLEKYIIPSGEVFDIFDEDDEKYFTEQFWEEFSNAYDSMNNREQWCAECLNELISKYSK